MRNVRSRVVMLLIILMQIAVFVYLKVHLNDLIKATKSIEARLYAEKYKMNDLRGEWAHIMQPRILEEYARSVKMSPPKRTQVFHSIDDLVGSLQNGNK